MGYFNKDLVLDINVTRIIERDVPLTDKILNKVDLLIVDICASKGVLIDEIPVDPVTGFVTSSALMIYAEAEFNYIALTATRGGVNVEDIGKDKMQEYQKEAQRAKKGVTYFTITGNQETRLANKIGSKPMW